MDVNEFIKNNGQRLVANPAYNPKSKKNTQPSSILVPDIGLPNNVATNMAVTDYLNQYSIDAAENEKYRREGLNWNPRENFNLMLAERQSNWSKLGNALGQTLVSEVILGTAKGLSDLVDFVGQSVGLSDHDYSNPISQYLEEKQEEFKNWAPIYTDPNKNIKNGGLTDFGWWTSNMPSIASSLTLLIPSTGVTKALSWAGKATKISKYTNRAARAIINPIAHGFDKAGFTKAEMGVFFDTGINAALSRTMENYQEARQTYNDTYADMQSSLRGMSPEEYAAFVNRNSDYLEGAEIDINDRDAVAKQIAKTSADRTFQLDFANVVFDAYQIYGLRNILTHAPRFNGSAATRAAQRESIRTAGMSTEQAAAEMAKDSKFVKAGHWVGDRFIGASRQIKSELSEGIEEAVNYIAQQEGTHLGKYILTGEGDERDMGLLSSMGPMTQRILNDYINDAGLWDSAFWGVLGGIVFQAGGSELNRISQTIKNRQDAKASTNKDNEETKEAKLTPHWWQLDQLSETERMVGDIKGRNVKLQTFKTAMAQINSGKNPYIKKADGTQQDISSPVEERMLREKAYTEYLDELIINSRNNGTLNMLEAYLENDNVRNAIVEAYRTGDEKGQVSEQEARDATEKAAARIRKIDNLYQNEIIHAGNIADRITDKKGGELPAEYIQMIASANVRHKLNLERYDEVAALYNEDTERIAAVVGDKLDSSIDYKGLISLKTTIQELSNLVAERKELEAQQKEKPTLSRQFDIEELDNQINVIKKKALQTSSDAQFARTLYALQVANSAVREYAPDGKNFKVTTSDIDLITNLDDMLTKDLSYIFDEVNQSKRPVSADAVIGELRKITSDMRYVLPTNSSGKLQDAQSYLDNIDPNLSENYDILSRIELEKIKEQAKIAETETEITHYVDAINNIENVARNKAIEDQFNILANIQRAHPNIDLLAVANTIYDENRQADFLIDTNALTETEREQVKEAFKILNIADVKNRSLFIRLAETLTKVSATQKQVNANDAQNTEKPENSSASQNPISAGQEGQVNNQSGTTQQQATRQANGQIDENQANNVPKFVTLAQDRNGKLIATASNSNTTPNDVPVRPLGNGMAELSFTTKDNNVNPNYTSNNTLFEIQQTPMDGGVVTRDPIVKIKPDGEIEVVAQGLVQAPVKSGVRQDVMASTVNQINNDPTLQQGLKSSNEETRRKTIDNIKNSFGLTDDELNQVLARVHAESSISSTGEPVQVSSDDDTTPKEAPLPKGPEAPVRGADPLEYIPQMTSIARQAAMDLKDGKTVTFEDYLASMADIRTAIGDDAEFERLAKEIWNRSMQRLAKKYPEAVDNLINSLQSSTTEEAPDTKLGYRFKTSFKKEVENLVKAYLKDIGQKKVNGKYVISLENLLRFCNGEFQNNENAELLYNVLANYLMSDDAKGTYEIIESKDEVAAPQFLDNVKTPIEERIDKAIREENHRINTREIVDKQVFDELEQGTELTTRKEKDRIYFEFDGKTVGFVGIPKVVNGTYSSPYGYFLFRIRPNGKNTYHSRLSDVFKSIVNAKDGDLKEILDAALVGGISIKDNKTWQAIKKEYGINTIDKETEEEYNNVDDNMLQTIRTMANFAVRYGSADAAIDAWFNNLVQEYIAANELAQNKDAKVVVDQVTDGFLIRAIDRLTDENRNVIPSEVDKLPKASKAIGRNYKGKVSIGVATKEAGTIATVVKKENDKVTIPVTILAPGVGYSNTFVVFPLSQGKTTYAQAYPITAKHLTSGTEAAKIVTAFRHRLDYYLKQIAANPNNAESTFRELQDFLFEALNYKNDTTPLFHMDNCEKVTPNSSDSIGLGTHLGVRERRYSPRIDLHIFYNKAGNHIVRITRPNPNDSSKTIKTEITITAANLNAISEEIRKFLADTLQFNIAENYIASDNNKRNQVTGLATRDKDGKFVIKIGDETFTFDSYNDFILDNDLVRVNTMPNEHGNNLTRTSSNPNVRYKIVTSSPVERNEEYAQPAEQDVATKANNIVSSTRTDKAAALARLIFDDDIVTTLSTYDLLPHNLVFDANFNTGEGRANLNASFNKSTKVTTIGPRFMTMLSSTNPAYRKQAIRKLIHERLHDILHSNGNEHYIQDIKNIYDTFVQHLDNPEVSKQILEEYLKKYKIDKSVDDFYDNFKKYKYLSKENEEVRLEEFLVDSLTSVELAEYLNSITSLSKVNMRERKRDTLLNKIMRLLAKIMGINIKNDSLYAQEFEALRKAMDSSAELTLQFENETNVEQEQKPKEDETIVEDTSEEINTQEPENRNVYQGLADTSDDDEYSSTTEEYESVASIADYIQSYSPEDRAEVAKEINNGEISIKCK